VIKSTFFSAAMAVLIMSYAAPAVVAQSVPLAQADDVPSYKPPLRGAPGGRIGGASRGASADRLSLEPLAPASHTGLTTSATPTLYYFASQAVTQPITLAIQAPNASAPLIETNIAAPRAAGIYAISLANYHVQLQPGVVYTWSVTVSVDPQMPSNDIVASATIMRVPPDPSVTAASALPAHRATLYAQNGLWYDALAAASEAETTDRHAAFDALLGQVGLSVPLSFDRSSH
jgi:hypothetical protein